MMKYFQALSFFAVALCLVVDALPNHGPRDLDAYNTLPRYSLDAVRREIEMYESPTRSHEKRATCTGNTPTTRTQWCEYDIETDYTETSPDTGVVREYWWELSSVTIAPDGVPRLAQAINGSFPGPTIYADWGDTIRVHVTSNLTSPWLNGTTIHWCVSP